MKKLWEKNEQLDKEIEFFETKGDIALDQNLVAIDVAVNLAHAKMLKKIGILSQKELSLIKKGLNKIICLDKQNNFIINAGDEDRPYQNRKLSYC